jgi:hypothetical protein
MATTTGVGSVPNPLDLGLIKGLFYERFAQTGQAELARRIAPFVDMATDEGSYVMEAAGFIGVNLVDDPTATDEVALSASNYRDEAITFEDKTYRLKRWQAGRFVLEDRKVGKMLRTHGVDVANRIEYRFRRKLEALHTHQAFSAATTSGNFLATYDPGNLSTASFDLIAALERVQYEMDDRGVDDSAPLILLGAPASIGFLQKLDQVKSHPVAQNPNFIASPTQLGQIISEYMDRDVEVVRARNRYRLENGTYAYSATANVLSFLIAGGGMQQSLLKTANVTDADAELLSIRQERDESIPATVVYADGYWDLHVGDKSAGVCWTGINA